MDTDYNMQCTRPLWLKDQNIFVPCGKCVGCKIRRRSDWAHRVLHESTFHRSNLFVTLTYNDYNLPKDCSIHKSEMQKFFKRVRKHSPDREFKYFCSGEYGDDGRPHYHFIGHNFRIGDFSLLGSTYSRKSRKMVKIYSHPAWMRNGSPIGNICIGEVCRETCEYVAKYIDKVYYGDMIKDIYGDKEQPFLLFSKGLGRRYAIENKEYFIQKLGCTVDGKEVGLNKYYRNVLDIEGKDVYNANKERMEKSNSKEYNIELRKLRTRNILGINTPEKLVQNKANADKMRELNQEYKLRNNKRSL